VAVPDPLPWFEVPDHRGVVWRVYLATTAGDPGLIGNAGLTYYATKQIVISVHEPASAQASTLLHEFQHAACDGIGMSSKTEEKLVAYSEPALFKVLSANGLRWPKRPVGYQSLRRKAARLSA
jgi:hypothetical protein